MTIGRFFAGIAALIWSAETNQYLLLRRSEQKDFARWCLGMCHWAG